MEISNTIFESITHALECEELRLKPRSEQPGKRLWPWTVRGGYYENWIRYLLVRELSGRCPDQELEIEAEVGGVPQVDLSICGLATVELKGPHKVVEQAVALQLYVTNGLEVPEATDVLNCDELLKHCITL